MPISTVTVNQAAWYRPAFGQENRDIAAEAYHTAIGLLKQELGIDPKLKIPEENLAKIEDVYTTVGRAKEVYDDAPRRHKGARNWLKDLSGSIMHYERVLDTLVQHHAEYVALVWGTFKLFFMTVNSHTTIMEGLAKALVDIADILPRTRLNAELYRTSDMEAVLSRLYASMFIFFRRCVEWYNKSSCARVWSSLKEPFELRYKREIADIETCSRLLDNLATAGARVEIRTMRTLTEADHAKLTEIDRRLIDAFDTQIAKLESINKGVARISNAQAVIVGGQSKMESRLEELHQGQVELRADVMQICQVVQASQSTLGQAHNAVFRLEFHQILNFFLPKTAPTDALLKVQPLAQRKPVVNDPRVERRLRDWVNDDCSSILLFQAGLRAQKQATELAGDIIKHLRRNGQVVFWNISAGAPTHRVSLHDVFKSIIYQALQQGNCAFADMGEQLHPQKIHSPHNDHEWVELICKLFARIPKAFVILETKHMHDTDSDSQQWASDFLNFLTHIVQRSAAAKCQLKVLLIMYGSAARDTSPTEILSIARLPPSVEVPQRLRNKAGKPGLNMKSWKVGGKRPLKPFSGRCRARPL